VLLRLQEVERHLVGLVPAVAESVVTEPNLGLAT